MQGRECSSRRYGHFLKPAVHTHTPWAARQRPNQQESPPKRTFMHSLRHRRRPLQGINLGQIILVSSDDPWSLYAILSLVSTTCRLTICNPTVHANFDLGILFNANRDKLTSGKGGLVLARRRSDIFHMELPRNSSYHLPRVI